MKLIDKDAFFKDICDYIERMTKIGITVNEQSLWDKLNVALYSAPIVNIEWIPVSERMPGNNKPVIITWKNNNPVSYYMPIIGKHFIGVAHYKNGKWYWYSSVTEDMLDEYGCYDTEEFEGGIEVVAWMPLPEPYQEKEYGWQNDE